VAEIMASPVDSLPADMPVGDIVAFFTAPDAPARHKSYPVLDEQGAGVGMVARADVLRWTMSGWPAGLKLQELLADQDLISGYDDELAGALADRMAAADIGRVPILRRKDRGLVGLVARRDLLRVRANVIRHEKERDILIRWRPKRSAG
jgi:CBS domain-containing protein